MQEPTTQRPRGIEDCNTEIESQDGDGQWDDGQAADERERVVETRSPRS